MGPVGLFSRLTLRLGFAVLPPPVLLYAAMLSLPTGMLGRTPWAAPDFSADILSVDRAGHSIDRGKLYVSRDRVRLEIPEAAAGFFLTDGHLQRALFVRPAQQLFMDARQSTPLTKLFVRVHPADACPGLHAAAEVAAGKALPDQSWRCEAISASHDSQSPAHRLLRYRLTAAQGEDRETWIDADLQFPVRWRSADDSTLELTHLQLRPQPSLLFELPGRYRKLDPAALLERIRHSDVWADSPH